MSKALLTIDLITLFPGMLDGFLRESIIGRAQQTGLVSVRMHNLRDWATDKHHVVDDRPLGGGAGMLLKPEPVFAAIEALKADAPAGTPAIYLCPDGEALSNPIVTELAHYEHIILLSGHYEGLDQRVRDHAIDREISIGDYVLTNGTLAAAVLIDAVSRHIPGVLGEEKSLTQDSFHDNLLTFPQYTRPAVFRGWSVPEVLLSGHHQLIADWRKAQQIEKTQKRRPDLFKK